MANERSRRPVDRWGDVSIAPGERRDLELKVGESYSGMTVTIPLQVRRGVEDGPVLFVTAALHGDELNGTGAIRALIDDEALQPDRGALILAPVLNVPGLDRHSRYLPDRRDLNRCFPGSVDGSLAQRMARVIFDEIVSRSDFGIDLHTAAVRRTNYPTLRADMTDPAVKSLAEAFAAELILAGRGPQGSLRRAACAAGCPTVVFEAGEVWKVEPVIVECAIQGVRNTLAGLGMLGEAGTERRASVVIEKKTWVRAERGGFLRFHASPGEVVEKGQALATNTTLIGYAQNVLYAPFNGVVLGMMTLPAVSPGEAVYHIGRISKKKQKIERLSYRRSVDGLYERLAEDLAANVRVVEPDGDAEGVEG